MLVVFHPKFGMCTEFVYVLLISTYSIRSVLSKRLWCMWLFYVV